MVAPHELKPGDHVYTECFEGVYHHHGIYVGEAKVTNPNNGEKPKIEHAVIHSLGVDKNAKLKTSKPQCQKCFYKTLDAGVVLTCLKCFRGDKGLYRYEYGVSLLCFNFKSSGSCSFYSCYEPDLVIKTAYSFFHDQNFGEYSFDFNNCEHFATKCKTGTAHCNQALWGTGVPGATVYEVVRGLTQGLLW